VSFRMLHWAHDVDSAKETRMSTAARARQPHSMARTIETRVESCDWGSVSTHLDGYGWAIFRNLLTSDECETISGLYVDDRHFRSHVVMARHGFGRGEYKYFSYP